MEEIDLKTWVFSEGMTIQEFCDFLDIKRVTFYRWTTGKAIPRERHMVLIKKLTKGLISDTSMLVKKNPGTKRG